MLDATLPSVDFPFPDPLTLAASPMCEARQCFTVTPTFAFHFKLFSDLLQELP